MLISEPEVASEVLVRWSNSFGNPLSPHLSSVGLGCVCETFRKLTIWHSHRFMPWLASCAEVRMEPGFERLCLAFFFHSWINYFCHFSCMSTTLWMPSRIMCLIMCAIIPVFKQYYVCFHSTIECGHSKQLSPVVVTFGQSQANGPVSCLCVKLS